MARAAALCLAIAAGAALLSFRPIYEPDLWWHLAQGREDAAGRLVRTNVFSFTYPDYRQQFTSWLFDTAAYFAWTFGEGAGVQLLQAVLIASTFGVLYAACRTRAPAWSASAVLFLAFFILEPRAIPRPHLVSFAGMALCTLLVERAMARRTASPLFWVVPLVAVWSNLHVECVFGVAFVSACAIAELIRPVSWPRSEALRALAIAFAAAMATMANPYGWGLLAYLYENMAVPQFLAIAELQPPYLPEYRAFFAYLAAAAALLLSAPRSIRTHDLLTLGIFGALGAMHLRLTPLVLLTTAPMVAAGLTRLAGRGIDRRAIVITAFSAALACSRIPLRMLLTELEVGTSAVAPPAFFSADAVAFIEQSNLGGNVFNSHNIGGYLAWTLYPRVRVFQDSRLQAYPPGHFGAVAAASRDQHDWDALVADVDWAVVSVPRPNQLSGHARFPAAQWESVFRDRAMEIVVRRDRQERLKTAEGRGPTSGPYQ